jgi:hypothetical protein
VHETGCHIQVSIEYLQNPNPNIVLQQFNVRNSPSHRGSTPIPGSHQA